MSRPRALPFASDRAMTATAASWTHGGGRGLAWAAKCVLDAAGIATSCVAPRIPCAGDAPSTGAERVFVERERTRAAAAGRTLTLVDVGTTWAKRGAPALDLSALLVGSVDGRLDTGVATALLRRVAADGVVVLPSDVRLTRTASAACRARRLTYGFDAAADIRGEFRRSGLDGFEIFVTTPVGSGTLVCARPGRRAAGEMLGALAFGLAAGVPLAGALDTLSRVRDICGSMERVAEGPVTVVIDDASTGIALAAAARDLRDAGARRVFTILGVEGDRSPSERGRLARAAAEFSDGIFLTVSHSRSEDPARLALAMVEGLPDVVECELEFDRVKAVRTALLAMRAGDALLIVGLGGDATAIEVGDRLLPCDDRALVRELTGTGVPA